MLIGEKNKVFSETGIDEAVLERNNIQVFHHMAEDALIDMYHRAEIVASLSVYEGFGIPVLEGLFCGCKAVCSDIAVYRELYEGAAFFCDPNDTNSIVKAIKEAASAKPPGPEEVAKLTGRYNYEDSARTIVADMLKG